MFSEYFAHVNPDTCEILGTNIKRGGTFKIDGITRQLGALSPDSTYAAMNLFPQIGERQSVTGSQKATGPVYEWDSANQIVNKVYVIEDIPIEDRIKSTFTVLKTDFMSYMDNHYDLGIQGTVRDSYMHPLSQQQTKDKAVEVLNWVNSVRKYYIEKKQAIRGGNVETIWDFQQFDSTKPIWDFEDFV